MSNKVLYVISDILCRISSKFENLCNYSRQESLKMKGNFGYDCSVSKTGLIINTQNNPNRLVVGSNTHIDGIIQVFPFGEGVKMGNNCYLGVNSRIWAADRIEIGDNVLISHNVNIMDNDSHEIDYKEREQSAIRQFKHGLPKEKGGVRSSPIIIKDNVWISFNVCVLKGVTIGKGSIIGCGAVVTHDIPDFCLAVGNPAKVIKKLDQC